jgi:hypothetical protein
MGFSIEYLTDGTVKATLNLKEEDVDFRCAQLKLPEPPQTKVEPSKQEVIKQEIPVSESKKAIKKSQEAASA